MCNCTETRREVTTIQDWDLGEIEVVEYKEYPATEDLDTHRFQCKKCGEIGYYSGRARAFYEKGERSPGVPGLE